MHTIVERIQPDYSAIAQASPQIIAVGTSSTEHSYTQRELLDRFKIEDRRIRSAFLNGGIQKRFLTLPDIGDDGMPVSESQGELLSKHRIQGIAMGARAIRACMEEANIDIMEIGFLCCVTTTGFLTPSLSAHLLRELGLASKCARLDVVGMGCNAGLNGLSAVSNWARSHPGKLAVLVCVEVCSAAYVFDKTSIETSVVNSLFGDGSAALAVVLDPVKQTCGPRLLKFASCLIPEAIQAMRFDWDDNHGKFNFWLDRDVPYVVGAHAEKIIAELLDGTELRRSDICHWIIHSGGKKVIDSVRINLGLSREDVRHTTGVLADYGNLSSGSFLFSYQRLLQEKKIEPNDYGIFMTMGPGSTIETALIHWQ